MNDLDPFEMYLCGFDAAIHFVSSLDDGSYRFIDNIVLFMREEYEDLVRGMQCNTSTQEDSSTDI